jgi:hypothetical protein
MKEKHIEHMNLKFPLYCPLSLKKYVSQYHLRKADWINMMLGIVFTVLMITASVVTSGDRNSKIDKVVSEKKQHIDFCTGQYITGMAYLDGSRDGNSDILHCLPFENSVLIKSLSDNISGVHKKLTAKFKKLSKI